MHCSDKQKQIFSYIWGAGLVIAIGGVTGWFTREGVHRYNEFINKPPLSPPSNVFPVVWTILFALMGISWTRIRKINPDKTTVFWVQLALNILWSIVFFNMFNFRLAFIVLMGLWVTIICMIVIWSSVDKFAAYLQIPYLLWVTFAAYLNYAVASMVK